jgi:hypothetical protein
MANTEPLWRPDYGLRSDEGELAQLEEFANKHESEAKSPGIGHNQPARPLGFQAPTCESTRSIDLAWLRRRGMLKPGRYSLEWSSVSESAGSISIVAQANGLRLLYRITGQDGAKTLMDEFMPFAYTATMFGGRVCVR